MKKVALICLAVLLLAPLATFAGDAPAKAKLADGQQRVELAVSGMSCGSCCTKVETAVKELDGVVDVTADYKAGKATVTFVKDKVSVDKIVAAINEKTSFKAEAPAKS